jgi:hypothetical protein
MVDRALREVRRGNAKEAAKLAYQKRNEKVTFGIFERSEREKKKKTMPTVWTERRPDRPSKILLRQARPDGGQQRAFHILLIRIRLFLLLINSQSSSSPSSTLNRSPPSSLLFFLSLPTQQEPDHHV